MASYLAVLEHESRSPEALDALERLYFRAERWEELWASTKRCSTSRRATRPCPTATRAWPGPPRTCSGSATSRSSCGGASSICAAQTPLALSALADLHEQAEEWRELTEVLDSQIRATEDPVARIPDVQAARSRVGRRLPGANVTLSNAGRRSSRSIRGDVEALGAIAENYRSAGAWEEAVDILRTTISVGTQSLSADEVEERSSTRSWASSRAPPSSA